MAAGVVSVLTEVYFIMHEQLTLGTLLIGPFIFGLSLVSLSIWRCWKQSGKLNVLSFAGCELGNIATGTFDLGLGVLSEVMCGTAIGRGISDFIPKL